MVMALAAAPAIDIDCPFLVVDPALNWTVPKLSRGSTPPPRPPLGASSTHSADVCDEAYCCVVSNVCPVVLLVKWISHSSGARSEMSTVTESPPCTCNGTGREARGSISIQASYCVRPWPDTICCVPAWIRSRLRTPPIPTHAASIPPGLSALNCGTVHVPVTWVNVPPVAAYPDQLCEVF